MAGRGWLQAIQEPSFPSQIDGRDRHWGWFALTIAAGIAIAFVALIVLVILQFIVFWALSPDGNPLTAMGRLVSEYMRLTGARGPANLSDTLEGFALLVLPNVAVFVAPVLMAAVILKKPFRLFLTAASRFRWKMMWNGMLVFAVVLLPTFVVLSLFDPERIAPPVLNISQDMGGRLAYFVAAIAFLLPAAAAEEILFRGWAMRQAQALFRSPWAAILIQGALFGLAHVNPNLDDTFQLAMMGLAFGYMAMRMGGIEFAIAAHAANNILLVLFFENLPFTPAGRHPFDPASFAGGFVVPALCIAVTELAVRWAPLGRFVGFEEREPERVEAFT